MNVKNDCVASPAVHYLFLFWAQDNELVQRQHVTFFCVLIAASATKEAPSNTSADYQALRSASIEIDHVAEEGESVTVLSAVAEWTKKENEERQINIAEYSQRTQCINVTKLLHMQIRVVDQCMFYYGNANRSSPPVVNIYVWSVAECSQQCSTTRFVTEKLVDIYVLSVAMMQHADVLGVRYYQI
ncbi:hypothetical protein BDQ17DRAFT_1327208 [Cyathus striatus]|nr:hypothetical protein BDQ17DRAFT_1327208 [Cyathus striatus]